MSAKEIRRMVAEAEKPSGRTPATHRARKARKLSPSYPGDGDNAASRHREPVELDHAVKKREGVETGLEADDREKRGNRFSPSLRRHPARQGAGDGDPRHHDHPPKPVDRKAIRANGTPEGGREGRLGTPGNRALQEMRPLEGHQNGAAQEEGEEPKASVHAPGPPPAPPLSFCRTKNIFV
ncbi:MAG: hypothetical protein ACYDBP_10835 [Leptospirales bacterium]